MVRRTASSRAWIKRHISDPFVAQAQQDGYRSRAVYKLKAIHERERLLRPGQVVLDLGAAPGSWSQYAASVVGSQGLLIAIDRLPMDPLPHVQILQGDWEEDTTFQQLKILLEGRPVDVILSDMAPNTMGIASVDGLRSISLAESIDPLLEEVLRPGGDLLVKVFEGPGFTAYRDKLRQRFEQVSVHKPEASRKTSPERFILARRFKIT